MLVELPFKGESMSPFLKEGDLLVVDTKKRTFSYGQIYVFRNDLFEMIAHRAVRIKPELIKGDRSLVLDRHEGWTLEGHVQAIIRGKKKFNLSKKPFILKMIAYFSVKNKKGNKFRYFSLIVLIVFSKIYFLISKSSS